MARVNCAAVPLSVFFIFFASMVHGGTQPKFNIVPVIPNGNNIQMSRISNTTVSYRVDNNTQVTRRLTLVPLNPAISQNTQAAGACDNPFILADNGESCVLSLVINGSQLGSSFSQAPKICKTMEDSDDYSPFLCSRTSRENILNINVGTPYAFIANAAPELGSRCDVDPSTGLFSNCVLGTTGTSSLEQIKLTSNGQQAYIVDASGIIITCAMGAEGVHSCFQTSATGLSSPQTITFNTDETYAYITNIGNSTISKCVMNSTNHNLTGCVTTGSNVSQPQGLVLNAANTRAYITNFSGAINVTQCDVNSSTWDLTNCADSGASLTGTGTDSMAFNTGESYAYITWNSGDVSKCTINASNGNLSCVDAGATLLNTPFGIAISSDNAFAFIVNFIGSTITTCSISSSTGNFTSCKNSGATTLGSPTSIELR